MHHLGYARRARCCCGKSVRPLYAGIESNSVHIVKLFPQSGMGMTLVSGGLQPLQKSKRNCFVWAVKYTVGGGNLLFSTKISVYHGNVTVGPWLLWITNRKL